MPNYKRSNKSVLRELALLTDHGDTAGLPLYRTSRSDVRRHSKEIINAFFKTSEIPKEDDSVLLDAVEKCKLWKQYVDQDDGSDSEVEREPDTAGDASSPSDSAADKAVEDEVLNFRLEGKLRTFYGLHSGSCASTKNAIFEFPLPLGDGLKWLNSKTCFKLPWDYYRPTVADEKEVFHWENNLKECNWIASRRPKKAKTWPSCNCTTPPCDDTCLNRSLQCECNATNCSFKHEDCGNRAFANLVTQMTSKILYATGWEVRPTEQKGLGLFAIRPYSRGTLIVEYTGDVIDFFEVEDRVETIYKERSQYYFIRLDDNLIIDAGQHGSVARFVNHSCDPNAEMQNWVVDETPRIGLFAKKDIAAGEEITYDYNFENAEDPEKCYCGSKHCRGYITRNPEPDGGTRVTGIVDTEIISEPIPHKHKRKMKMKAVDKDEEEDQSEDDEQEVDNDSVPSESPYSDYEVLEEAEDEEEDVVDDEGSSQMSNPIDELISDSEGESMSVGDDSFIDDDTGLEEEVNEDDDLIGDDSNHSQHSSIGKMDNTFNKRKAIMLTGSNEMSTSDNTINKQPENRLTVFSVNDEEVNDDHQGHALILKRRTRAILGNDEDESMGNSSEGVKKRPIIISDQDDDDEYRFQDTQQGEFDGLITNVHAGDVLMEREYTRNQDALEIIPYEPNCHSMKDNNGLQVSKHTNLTPVLNRDTSNHGSNVPGSLKRPRVSKKAPIVRKRHIVRQSVNKVKSPPKEGIKATDIFGHDLFKLKKSKRSIPAQPDGDRPTNEPKHVRGLSWSSNDDRST